MESFLTLKRLNSTTTPDPRCVTRILVRVADICNVTDSDVRVDRAESEVDAGRNVEKPVGGAGPTCAIVTMRSPAPGGSIWFYTLESLDQIATYLAQNGKVL